MFLGYKSLARGNKATIALMVFIMSLAFVNLIFISGILNGIVMALEKQIRTNLVSDIVIEPQEKPTRKDFIIHAGDLEREIGNLPGVMGTAGSYKLAGTVAYDKEKNGKFKFASTEILGIDPEEQRNMNGVAENIIVGRYLEGLGIGDVLIGADLAGGYGGFEEVTSLDGARVGEKIRITFSNGLEREYTIRGIYKVRFGFADRRVLITKKEAETVLSVYNNASQILVKTDGTVDEDRLLDQIQKIAPNLRVKKWTEYTGAFGGVTQSFNMITLIISVIGLAVAAVTIFILVYVNVVHKRRQIGILKAIGIKQNIIVYSYILQALFYAVSGVVIGTLLIFFALVPYFLKNPLQLPMGDTSLALDNTRVIYSVAGLIAAAFVAGFIPSRRGAKENILKAIWGA